MKAEKGKRIPELEITIMDRAAATITTAPRIFGHVNTLSNSRYCRDAIKKVDFFKVL